MSDMLKKLMEKKQKSGKMLSDSEQEAKMSVLHQLKKSMDDVMSERADGMKKISVMSDSKGGLEEGLEKAKEIVENPMLAESEEKLEEPSEEEMLSEEEIDAKLAELMALKEKLKS